MKPTKAAAVLAVLAQGLLVACGGGDVTGPGSEDDDPAADAPSFADEVHPIFASAGCASSDCHGGGVGGLTLGTYPTANYSALVGVASSCNSLLQVAPGDPTNSFLLMKLEGRQPCGDRMPLSGGTITNGQVETIRSWITAGAPDN